MVGNAIDPIQAITQILDVFQNVRSTIQECETELTFRDNEYNDLTHALELTTFDAATGYMLAKQLKENRLKRRAAKDLLAQLQPLAEVFDRYQNLINDMRRAKTQIEKIKNAQQLRIYTPRARTDMMEAFERARAKKEQASSR